MKKINTDGKQGKTRKNGLIAGKNVILNSFQNLKIQHGLTRMKRMQTDWMQKMSNLKLNVMLRQSRNIYRFFAALRMTCFKFKIFVLGLFLIFPLSAEQIAFHADAMSGKTGSKSDATTLSGNAYVKTETMEIKADSITLSGENFRYITASGNVDGKNTESKLDFTCGNMRYDRNTKVARLEDAVHMVDTENDVKADAQIIEYDQNTEIATMQINVSIKQKDNTCTAAYALYRKAKQMLEMTGNPKIVQGEDTFRAQEISLNLDTQEIRLDGRVSGQVSDSKKSDDKSTSAKNDSTAKTTQDSTSDSTRMNTDEHGFTQTESDAKQEKAKQENSLTEDTENTENSDSETQSEE